jgi:hypothetical protein
MKSIVYLSDASVDFSETDLVALAEHAAATNYQLDVTGYLCFSRNRFLQYLEGEAETVDALLSSIRKDPRHKFIYEIELNDIDQRVFDHWSMRYITADELQRFHLEHYIELNLLYIKNNFPDKERCRDYVWKHVKTIANVKECLARAMR